LCFIYSSFNLFFRRSSCGFLVLGDGVHNCQEPHDGGKKTKRDWSCESIAILLHVNMKNPRAQFLTFGFGICWRAGGRRFSEIKQLFLDGIGTVAIGARIMRRWCWRKCSCWSKKSAHVMLEKIREKRRNWYEAKQKTAMGNEQMTKAGPKKWWLCGGGKKKGQDHHCHCPHCNTRGSERQAGAALLEILV
jgi:hypothetical protein